MWGIVIAVISGALMSIQGVFNTEVTKQTSLWVSAAFVHITALLVCLIAWFLTGRESSFMNLFHIHPRYILLGGTIGAFITYTVIEGMNRLGPARAAIFIVVSQIIVAYLIEVFGLFGVEKTGFEWKRAMGVLIVAAGIVLFKWK